MKKDELKKVEKVTTTLITIFGIMCVFLKNIYFFRILFAISVVAGSITSWYTSKNNKTNAFPKLIMYIILTIGSIYIILLY